MSGSFLGGDADARARFKAVEDARDRGDWAEAIDTAIRLLKDRVAGRGTPDAGDHVLVEMTADLAAGFGLYAGAADLLSGLARRCDASGRIFLADYLTLKRVHLDLDEGRTDEARCRIADRLGARIGPLEGIPILAEDLPAWEDRCRWPETDVSPVIDRSLFFSRLYLVLGRWLASQGYYEQGRVLLDRGIIHAEPPASSLACRARVTLQLERAAVYLEQGRLDRCGEDLAWVEPRLDQKAHPGWTVHWLELAGYRDWLLGELGSASRRYDEITEICRGRGFVRALATALMNQAELLIGFNRVSEAEDLLESVSTLGAVSADPAVAARLRRLRAFASERVRSPTERLALVPAVIELQGASRSREVSPRVESRVGVLPAGANGGRFLAFFEDCAALVRWSLGAGDRPRARALADELHRDFAAAESPLLRLRIHALLGMVAYYEGDYEVADRVFAEVEPHLEALGLRPEHWQVLRFREWCALRRGLPPLEAERLGRRAEELLAAIAGTLRPADMAIFLLNKWTARERRLRAEADALTALQAACDGCPWYFRPWRKLSLYRRAARFLQALDADRRRASGLDEMSDASGTGTVRGSWLVRTLLGTPTGSATLAFLVLPDRVLIVMTGGLGVRCEFGYIDRAESGTGVAVRAFTDRRRVRRLVALCHEAVVRHDRAGFDAVSERLAAELRLTGLLSRLPRWVKRLRVVADDALHGYPFAALRPEGGYLIERFRLSMVYEHTVRRPVVTPTPDGVVQALLVGVSRPAGRIDAPCDTYAAAASVPGLAGVVREIEGLNDWLSARGLRMVRLVDSSATPDAITDHIGRSILIHVACHGVFEPDRPDASGLVLVPEPDRGVVFTLRELEGLEFGAVRHVTLSSCWGADNFVHPGRWVVSLPETLCRRGVGSVLACLWAVSDDVAPAFMRRFYELLDEYPRDEALRRVQRECAMNALEGVPVPTDDPLLWAGFRLHGAAGRLAIGTRLRPGPRVKAREPG